MESSLIVTSVSQNTFLEHSFGSKPFLSNAFIYSLAVLWLFIGPHYAVRAGLLFEVLSDSEFSCLWCKNVETQPVLLFLLLWFWKESRHWHTMRVQWPVRRDSKRLFVPPSCISDPRPRHAFPETGCTIRTIEELQQQHTNPVRNLEFLLIIWSPPFLEDCVRWVLNICGNIPKHQQSGTKMILQCFFYDKT